MAKCLTYVRALFAVVIIGLSAEPADAGVLFTASGTSKKGVDVTFKANLSISGNTLTLLLTNDSPVDSLNPDDVLGSFYFDIIDDSGIRPTLEYSSATGDVYKGVKNGADILLEKDADLQALAKKDSSWQFKNFNAEFTPFLGFGLGTVGNSNMYPNNFNGNIVSSVNFAIYKGKITTQPLVNPNCLVKDQVLFTFTGLTGFTEADIASSIAFGLGTAPDSLLVNPEPATAFLLALGGLMLRAKRCN